MVDKDYKLYGTKILNLKTQEIGLLICLWENKFADKTVDFATCVDKTGKRYNWIQEKVCKRNSGCVWKLPQNTIK